MNTQEANLLQRELIERHCARYWLWTNEWAKQWCKNWYAAACRQLIEDGLSADKITNRLIEKILANKNKNIWE